MGLRTASVRHPRVEVMAPALTETNQSAQTFKLPPQDQFASPTINGTKSSAADLFIPCEATTCKDIVIGRELKNNNAFGGCDALTFATDVLKGGGESLGGQASDNDMSSSLSMGDQEDNKMGLQKSGLDDVSELLGNSGKAANESSEDEIFNMQVSESDIPNNVEDIMQVIKSMESGPIFSGADLTGESLEEELFKDVDVDVMDVMNIEDEIAANALQQASKESRTRDLLDEVNGKQVKLERKMEHLIRTIRKFQVRHMGQHVSGEIAGVFEHVHRTLKRSKAAAPKGPVLEDSGGGGGLGLASSSSISDTSVSGGGSSLSGADTTSVSVSVSSSSEKVKPLSFNSTKSLLKKLELSNAVSVANYAFKRQQQASKCFGSSLSGPVVDPCGFRTPAGAGGQAVTLPQWTADEKRDLQNVAGNLEAEMRVVQNEVDSEATASSSGGESCDENETYNNPHQQFLPIHKRAAWKYATDRSAIASKWTWLQSQISDLEYRIRQHTELHRKLRGSKEPVRLGGASPPPPLNRNNVVVPLSPNCLNGYRGQLPGASPLKNGETSSSLSPNGGSNGSTKPSLADVQCARTRPLVNFRKRKLLQLAGLHVVSKRAARPSTVRCGCTPPEFSCALCTGRTDPTYPRDIPEYLSRNEMLALLDPAYHPVFSMREDASASVHMEAIMKTSEWQQRSSRSNLKSMKYVRDRGDKSSAATPSGPPLEHRPRKIEHRKKYNRLIKPSTANALSAKIKNRYHRGRKQIRHGGQVGRLKKRSRPSSGQCCTGSDGADEEVEALGILGSSSGKYDSPSSSPLLAQAISGLQKRNRVDSYDIDNIIIPYSVAALTRVEKLEYKEILTPKWRIADNDLKSDVKNNGGIVKSNSTSTSQDVEQEEEEDVSDEAVLARHEKCEQDERKKFLTYLKLPIGYGRSRANRRTDSRAESSGANTPDPMSPAPNLQALLSTGSGGGGDHQSESASASTTPPATPQSIIVHDDNIPPPMTTFPSVAMSAAAMRRRTVSQNKSASKEIRDETTSSGGSGSGGGGCGGVPDVEVPPYEKRLFPMPDEIYDKMVRNPSSWMADETTIHHVHQQQKTRRTVHHQAPIVNVTTAAFLGGGDGKQFNDDKDFPQDSESTESAYGDEDPNDPEWDVAEENKEMFCR